jgi:hypothetical protein
VCFIYQLEMPTKATQTLPLESEESSDSSVLSIEIKRDNRKEPSAELSTQRRKTMAREAAEATAAFLIFLLVFQNVLKRR